MSTMIETATAVENRTEEQLLSEIKKLDTANIKTKSVKRVPLKGGHYFVVGVRHVAYASDHCGGILGQEVLDKIPCDYCNKMHSDPAHKLDTAQFVNIAKDVSLPEWLGFVKTWKQRAEEIGISGLAFASGFDYLKNIGVVK